MSLVDEILGAFGNCQVNINDLPEDDPTAVIGRTCETLFTDGVDTLRTIIPNDRVRALAREVWNLVGHKQVVVAIGPDVPTLTFTVMQLRKVHQGIVLIPKNWPEQVRADTCMELGAILFVGAQIVDFYNDRLIDEATAPPRWYAYEAELLLALKQSLPQWEPNAHQHQVLAKYPNGLDSPGVVTYAFKSYEPAKGSA